MIDWKHACSIVAIVFSLTPQVAVRASNISSSEFLKHCEAEPEPCKNKVLSYVKFLADAGSIDACVMHLPANDVATKLIGWMREHPEQDWVDSLDTALTALDLCRR